MSRVANTETTALVPYHYITSLHLIRISGTSISEFQMSCKDLSTWQGARMVVPVMAVRRQAPFDNVCFHDDVIKWKHFPRYWPFVQGIHWSPVDSPHKGQWRGALMFSLICTWINGWVNNCEAGDLRRHSTHYDVTVMRIYFCNAYESLHIQTMCHVYIKLVLYIYKFRNFDQT